MITCAEALTKQWRWARDMVLWWDYTTTPYPTVHFRKADNLAAVTIDLNAAGQSGAQHSTHGPTVGGDL